MRKLYKDSQLKLTKEEILENYGKALLLLEAYLKGVEVKAFSLIADMAYVV